MVNRFFLDTSALIKRYTAESGTTWVQALTAPTSKRKIVLSEITLAEFASAIARKHRTPHGISHTERDRTLALFLEHCRNEYELTSVSRAIIDRAVRLTQNHKLRGYDAVQLGSGLVLNEKLLAVGAPPLTFVAADHDLLAAANAEGLATENPNLYR